MIMLEHATSCGCGPAHHRLDLAHNYCCAPPRSARQVPRRMIGTDAFQETPIVEVTRAITKHNYLVMDVADLPRCGPLQCMQAGTHACV